MRICTNSKSALKADHSDPQFLFLAAVISPVLPLKVSLSRANPVQAHLIKWKHLFTHTEPFTQAGVAASCVLLLHCLLYFKPLPRITPSLIQWGMLEQLEVMPCTMSRQVEHSVSQSATLCFPCKPSSVYQVRAWELGEEQDLGFIACISYVTLLTESQICKIYCGRDTDAPGSVSPVDQWLGDTPAMSCVHILWVMCLSFIAEGGDLMEIFWLDVRKEGNTLKSCFIQNGASSQTPVVEKSHSIFNNCFFKFEVQISEIKKLHCGTKPVQATELMF